MKLLSALAACFALAVSFSAFAQQLDWARSIGGSNYDYPYDVAVDDAGNVVTVGIFNGIADFDPGAGTFVMSGPGAAVGYYTIFVSKLDANGNFVWAKEITGTSNKFANAVATDAFGNIYLTGKFQDTLDCDPGAGVAHLISTSTGDDIYICKLDGDGNHVWSTQFGGTMMDVATDIIVDPFGNVLTTGYFGSGSIDFDPSPATFTIYATFGWDNTFVSKLDPNGGFVWAKGIGGDEECKANALATDLSGNVYLTGGFTGTVDFDPDGGTFNLAGGVSFDAFVWKLNDAGNFIWARAFSGTDDMSGGSTAADANGNVLTIGTFTGTADFDPGVGNFSLTGAPGLPQAFISKLDAAGNFVWAKNVDVTQGGGYEPDIAVDASGSAYYVSTFIDSTDADPGVGATMLYGVSHEAFVSKLGPTGDFVWAVGLGGAGPDIAAGLALDQAGSLVLTGKYSGTSDFDPGPGVAYLTSASVYDGFIVKLQQDVCANFTLVVDSVSDVTCLTAGFVSAYVINGTPPIEYAWSTASTTVSLPAFAPDSGGLYQLTVVDSIGCQRSTAVVVAQPSFYAGYDLNANSTATPLQPGFEVTIWIDAFNDGCLPVTGSLACVLPSELTYTTAVPTPFVSGDTLMWEFADLTFDGGHLTPAIGATASASVNIDDVLCYTVIISPDAGDQQPLNNLKDYCTVVTGSYDPNDKNVFPRGECASGYVVNNGAPLTYTVRFQNTGTAPAVNVFILDTLDGSLDLQTLNVVGKSHTPLITEVVSGNVIKFRFDNILLPDSFTAEPLSHGYVMYEVTPLPLTASGTVVKNSAAIFFDFNEPVLTNAVQNTLVDTLPFLDALVLQYAGALIATSGADAYEWVDCNSLETVSNSMSFSPAQDGAYAYNATLGTCVFTSSCFAFTGTALEGLSMSPGFSIYPNPVFDDDLFVSAPEGFLPAQLEITNMAGKVIRSHTLEQPLVRLDAPAATGIFLLKLTGRDGTRSFVKLVCH